MTMRTHSMASMGAGLPKLHTLLRYGLFFVLVALFIGFALAHPIFSTWGNVASMWRTASIAGLMFIGLTWVIASGEMDVSFMEVAALSGMVFAFQLQAGASPAAAVGVAMLCGAGIGVVNGLLVGYLAFPSLIVTIATAGLARSFAAILGGGQPIYINDSGVVGHFADAVVWGMPIVGIAVVLVYLLGWFVQERRLFGHYLFAMADNRRAMEQVGVACKPIVFSLFVISACGSALAGIILASSLDSGQPMIGNSFFLDGLTAVLLGATVIRFGKPNIIGTAIGVCILAIMVNGLALLGMPNFMREIFKGVLLLIGVAIAVTAAPKSKSI